MKKNLMFFDIHFTTEGMFLSIGVRNLMFFMLISNPLHTGIPRKNKIGCLKQREKQRFKISGPGLAEDPVSSPLYS